MSFYTFNLLETSFCSKNDFIQRDLIKFYISGSLHLSIKQLPLYYCLEFFFSRISILGTKQLIKLN